MFQGSIVALITPFKNNEVDEKLLPDVELINEWIRGINNPDLVPTETLYGDLVEKQHLNEFK